MNNGFMQQLRDRRESFIPKILFTDGEDERVLVAAMTLADEKIAQPIILGDLASITRQLGRPPEGIEVLDPTGFATKYSSSLAEKLRVSGTAAAKLVQSRTYIGAAMLDDGYADALVAGIHEPTAEVLLAYEKVIQREAGAKVVSGAFVLDTSRGAVVLVDAAGNPNPDAQQLAEIALQAADACPVLIQAEPRVTLLGFGDGPKVTRASQIVRERRPSLTLDGEIHADASLDSDSVFSEIGARVLGGTANLLVFPDLDAANMGCKLLRTLAHANAYGTFLLGMAEPAVKLSRSATSNEILGSCLILREIG